MSIINFFPRLFRKKGDLHKPEKKPSNSKDKKDKIHGKDDIANLSIEEASRLAKKLIDEAGHKIMKQQKEEYNKNKGSRRL